MRIDDLELWVDIYPYAVKIQHKDEPLAYIYYGSSYPIKNRLQAVRLARIFIEGFEEMQGEKKSPSPKSKSSTQAVRTDRETSLPFGAHRPGR